MCGIAGVFHRNGDKVDRELVVRLTRTLAHRGPDEEGYFFNAGSSVPPGSMLESAPIRGRIEGGSGYVGLGHRRLSIIDLSSGQQPLSNEDGTVWIVYNGEIYNFQSLVAELEAKGHTLRTSSDTEVIVHLYEEYQEDFVRWLRGMFGLAIWDSRRKKLVLARDRM